MTHGDRYTLTAALPYANGPLHIGHLAGAYLSADAYARFLRLFGKEVLFVCGSDEYGAAIEIKAKKENTTPQAIVEKYHAYLRDALQGMHISFDIYHRTTSPIHTETAQDFFLNLLEKGCFEERETEQFYDQEAQMFLADRFIQGTCPQCGNEEAYGDQCEKCGSTLSPEQLINPKSTLSQSTPLIRKTKHWYLSLDKHQAWLKDWIENGILDGQEHHDPSHWKKHVTGQCLSWLDQGLEPRSMTRDLSWGVPVPQHIEGSEGKKLYVWLDAPIGYITATKEWANNHGKDWKEYWGEGKTNLIHFIGKDNIVFHCITFPVILKSYGGLALPMNVPANQFLNFEGKKISTSKGWAVWVHEFLQEFKGKEDIMRYTLFKNMPEQKDSEFTWVGFQEANNADLVNNLANFINRTVVLANKYYDGVVPDFEENQEFYTSEEVDLPIWHDSDLLDLFDTIHEYVDRVNRFDFRSALKIVMKISSRGNGILQANEPWKKNSEEPELVATVINVCLQYATAISILIRPFMPVASEELRDLLRLPKLQEAGELNDILEKLAEGEILIPAGHQISEPVHLFSRIEDDVILKQKEKLYTSSTPTSDNPSSSQPNHATIDFEDFSKVDLRVAHVISAEKVIKANRLLKLELQLGDESRTVVSGIAEHYKPEDIIGKQVVIVANLAPRKIKGIDSQGMVLMAEDADGKLGFVAPPEGWPSGHKVS